MPTPLDAISPKELDRANLKRAFVLDGAEAFDAEAFAKRLEPMPDGGDRASICACLMAEQRKRKERDTALNGILGKEVRSWAGSAVPPRSRRRSAMKGRPCGCNSSLPAARWGPGAPSRLGPTY